MDNLDALLGQLARAPVHPGLASMEHRVLATISSRTARQAGLGVSIATITAALLIGVAGGVPASATDASPLIPLGPSSPLAPSTLLAGVP
ncbi:hypothetical protein [Tardiphaga sp.]|uniref:hypothetical protein n=1 Tax=Tardiphaga sp. TaxID=1926292 RepID=UPI00352BB77B